MNVRRCLAALTAGAVLFLACGEEETVVGCDPCPPPSFESLTQRWHVLNNLQLSYNEREFARMDELLDTNFVFYLAPRGGQGGIPAQWGRDQELDATRMLFDPDLNVPGFPVCQGIYMNLEFENGVAWDDTVPPAFPAETWYTATVYYDDHFYMEPGGCYTAVPGSQAQFTVRNVGTDGAPQWRLVEWHDLGTVTTERLQPAAACWQESWGFMKALYYGRLPFPPPTQRDIVLSNLELSYNQRNPTEFAYLLDDNFTFFFAPGDVGGNIPEQWGRADELRVASKLFDKNLNEPPYPTCRSIRVDLKLESGVQWVAVIPEGFPAETWYTATVPYDFTFEMIPDQTYSEVPGSQAQFTVRNSGTESAPQWSLVEWRDLGGGSLAARGTSSTENTTWGGVKALYK